MLQSWIRLHFCVQCTLRTRQRLFVVLAMSKNAPKTRFDQSEWPYIRSPKNEASSHFLREWGSRSPQRVDAASTRQGESHIALGCVRGAHICLRSSDGVRQRGYATHTPPLLCARRDAMLHWGTVVAIPFWTLSPVPKPSRNNTRTRKCARTHPCERLATATTFHATQM